MSKYFAETALRYAAQGLMAESAWCARQMRIALGIWKPGAGDLAGLR